MELLRVRSEDKPNLKQWLQRERKYTHPDIQNEILQIFGREITLTLTEKIKSKSPLIFSVICDGTRDISGDEQESICVRWLEDNLDPQETFLGFYKTNLTTGEEIASLITDALLRRQLPLEGLRGQTYDGAGNMSGSYKHKSKISIPIHPRRFCSMRSKQCNQNKTIVPYSVGFIGILKSLKY